MLFMRKKDESKFLFMEKIKNVLLLLFHQAFVKTEFYVFRIYEKELFLST